MLLMFLFFVQNSQAIWWKWSSLLGTHTVPPEKAIDHLRHISQITWITRGET
ncbi:hypothetical protein GLYMA_15G049566v4 [Glycine max]|nr:hypothetical protein GLYMA_15G049566v4 [Glycine max]KAH1145637.1 hypothetical protein GYH30_041381 [Glycine max]